MNAPTPRAVHGGPRGEPSDTRLRVDASTNVNAYGPAPVVAAAAASADITSYPDPLALGPRRAAAARWNRPIKELAFGAGTSELVLASMLALLRQDDAVVLSTPLYGEYARTAALVGARTVEVPRADTDNTSHTLSALIDAMRRSAARLVIVCAPGNPLGDAWCLESLRELADAAGQMSTIVLLDQSYDAFLPAPLGDPALGGHPAVLHLRSLTKDHAIPGLRAGFACGPEPLIERIESVRVPWSASAPAQAAAAACFTAEAEAHVRRTAQVLRRDALTMTESLGNEGMWAHATDVHWLLCDVGDAERMATTLELHFGVRARPLGDHGMPHMIRVAARQPLDNDIVRQALIGAHRSPESPSKGR